MLTLRQKFVSSITRRYPLLSGCGTFANSGLVHRLAGGDSQEPVWTRLDCGAEILVPLNDYIGRAAFYVGDFDRKISAVIRQIVRPGDQVLDIGANIGIVTLYLAKLVGPQGAVHSFEPNPKIASLLSRSVERNGMTQVHVHPHALGAEESTLSLSIPGHNAGQATLKKTRTNDTWNNIEVKVRTLSQLAEEIDVGNVRLLKMDVEGFELEVIRGASSWLSAHPPDAMIFETNEKYVAGEVDPLLQLLIDQDYVLYSVPKRLFSLKLKLYDPTDTKAIASHDMLALRRNCEREIISKFRV